MSDTPPGLDEFVQTPPQAQAAPPPPAGLDQFIAPEVKAQQYGSTGQQILAGVEGLGQGFAGPLFTGAEKAASALGVPGLTPEDQQGREDANPVTYNTAQAAGFIGGDLTGVGEAAMLGKAARLLPGTAELGKVGSAAARGAVEMGLLSGVDEVSKAINDDPNQTAGTAMAHVGLGALLGAGGGAVLGKIFPKWLDEAQAPVEQGIQDFKNTMSGSVTDQAAEEPVKALTEAKMPASSEVAKIGTENNWPVLEGMVDKSKPIQMAEDSLLNGAPTMAANSRRKLYLDALDKVTDSVDGAVSGSADMSETEAGNFFKDSINSKLSDEYAPTKALYDEIQPYRQAIPISDRSTGSLSRNVEKLIQEKGLIPGTERYNFVKTISDGLSDVDDLQKLANFRTEIGKSAGPLSRDLAGDINDRLNGVEDRAIKRYSETMKTPEAKQKITDLISKSDQAKAGYAQFRDKLQTLGNSIGKKKIYGPQNFMDFVENMNPQQLTKRLFNENNTEFAQYFAKEFPEEFKTMRDYQRGLIRNSTAVAKDGSFQIGKAIESIQKMEPEMQKLLYSKAELKTVEDARKYLASMPKGFNWSNTDHMRSFRDFFESPKDAMVANLRDYGIQKFIQTFGKVAQGTEPEAERLISVLGKPALEKDADAAGFKHAVEYVMSAIKGDKFLEKSAKSLFNSATPVISEVMDPGKLAALDKKVKAVGDDPDQMGDVGGNVGHYLPNHDIALKGAVAQAAAHLNSIRPQPIKLSPMENELKPSDQEQRNYNRALSIVSNPVHLLSLAKEGRITTEDVAHAQAAQPAALQAIRQKVTNAMTDHLSKGKTVPYSLRSSLSTLMGTPMDSTLQYSSVMSNQAALQSGKAQAQQIQPQGKMTASGMKGMAPGDRLSLADKDTD